MSASDPVLFKLSYGPLHAADPARRKVARSLTDAIRYRMEIAVNCSCGHEARITARALYEAARARKPPNCLRSATTHLKMFEVRPERSALVAHPLSQILKRCYPTQP